MKKILIAAMFVVPIITFAVIPLISAVVSIILKAFLVFTFAAAAAVTGYLIALSIRQGK